MDRKISEDKLTGAGGIGISRPGTAEMTKQVSAGSLSSHSKETATGADPGPRSQVATGKNKNKNIMEGTNKSKNIAGAGELGGLSPGAEGIWRVPSASSSDDRGGDRVASQARSRTYTTGSAKEPRSTEMIDTDCRTKKASSGDEVFKIPKKTNIKRRKRTISFSTISGSEATICSDREAERQKTDSKARSSTLGKVRKKLPTEEERMAELRNTPTANLASNMLKVAPSLEQMAATAGNLKGTYVRRLRDDAGKVRANTTELVKRTTVAGAQVALENENIQLTTSVRASTIVDGHR